MSLSQQSKVYQFNLRNSNHTLDLADNLKWIRELNAELSEFMEREDLDLSDAKRIDELERQLRMANRVNRDLKEELKKIEQEFKEISRITKE